MRVSRLERNNKLHNFAELSKFFFSSLSPWNSLFAVCVLEDAVTV